MFLYFSILTKQCLISNFIAKFMVASLSILNCRKCVAGITCYTTRSFSICRVHQLWKPSCGEVGRTLFKKKKKRYEGIRRKRSDCSGKVTVSLGGVQCLLPQDLAIFLLSSTDRRTLGPDSSLQNGPSSIFKK